MFAKFIQNKLENYVRQYFAKHPEVKLVIVTGSVGKTSTKVAIGTVLSEKFRIRMHEGNHNATLSTPVAMLGIEYPTKISNPMQWMRVFAAAKKRINDPTDVDVIIQEVGSDRIGQVPHFGTYATPDIAVVTAVSAEHMEYFGTIDAVAREELAAANFSKHAIINRDDIDGKFSELITNASINTYGTSGNSEYNFINEFFTIDDGYRGKFSGPEISKPFKVNIHMFGEHSLRPAIAAGAVAAELGLSDDQIAAGLGKIHAVSGRMNVLHGIKKSMIIDDTYNSSPLAVECALTALYQLTVSQKIAVLGDMNELGDMSDQAHIDLGKLCDKSELNWVITVGAQAKKFIAVEAQKNGCQVKSFDDPVSAGEFVRTIIDEGAAVLFKGSQGGIFLEEAVKLVLSDSSDESKLVRQSPDWIAKKSAYFATK